MEAIITTAHGQKIREAKLEKIGPAIQKIDLWRQIKKIWPPFSRPRLDNWMNWATEANIDFGRCYLAMVEAFGDRNYQREPLHPYQCLILWDLFLYALDFPNTKINKTQAIEFIQSRNYSLEKFNQLEI